ncbi:MAG: hypothetical protein JWN24_4184 [Phycisphaerales bacterium]|nr:hypothetical protein [Phycisphaerales bacterium]
MDAKFQSDRRNVTWIAFLPMHGSILLDDFIKKLDQFKHWSECRFGRTIAINGSCYLTLEGSGVPVRTARATLEPLFPGTVWGPLRPKLAGKGKSSYQEVSVTTAIWPRIWDSMGYLLPRETRLRIYMPSIEEKKLDYFEAYEASTGKWARRWLGFCFAFRTALLVGDCWRLSGADRFMRWVRWIYGASLLHWLFHR